MQKQALCEEGCIHPKICESVPDLKSWISILKFNSMSTNYTKTKKVEIFVDSESLACAEFGDILKKN
jgi:hypothetical protein